MLDSFMATTSSSLPYLDVDIINEMKNESITER